MRSLYLVVLLFFIAAPVWGATRTAVASGNWTTPATWDTGVPLLNDNVIIPSGITVTISANWTIFFNIFPAYVNNITVNGTLHLNNAGLSLNSYDVLTINAGGQITASGFAVISSGFTFFTTLTPGLFPIIGPATISGGALPITLLFFEGQQFENGVVLKWASATELNFDYYRVVSSTDGEKFEMLGDVKGSFNSEERKDYELIDHFPALGKNYYRLVSVDLDGYTEYFDVILVNYQPEKTVIDVYPNPITLGENVLIQPNFKLLSGSKIDVMDLQGKSVIDSFVSNNTSIELSTSQLSAGMYLIRLTTNQGIFTEKLVVR
jgi:Secretion system C-terminal sorting domain